ncbi:MAG: FG-GAP-like repeat-containing protein [Verrucomicrobiae bacterium]|nr:FG-GAP-like repeat-containing protein [Verrucomicrobiae bacterium]
MPGPAQTTVNNTTLVISANSHASDTVSVINNGLLKGNGTVANLSVSATGRINPGASPGTITVVGDATWGPAGIYEWEINDALGTAGADPGWDLLQVGNNLNITATPANRFVVKIITLNGGSPGAMANFNKLQPYTWKIASATNIVGFALNKFILDVSGVVNDFSGGEFALVQSGNDILVCYFPNPVITVGPGGDYASIQAAVNDALPQSVILVYADTYIENVAINKPLTLLGPNFGKAGSNPGRGPEAVVMSAVNDPEDAVIFAILASNVVVDGFYFDGDNPMLTGGYTVGTADVNAAVGIQNSTSILNPFTQVEHVTVQNNVFKNFSYGGIYLEVNYLSSRSWNYIRHNYFEQQWEGLQLYAIHAVIDSNVMTNVGRGLSVHAVAAAAATGFNPAINNNTITLGGGGVWNPLATRNAGIWVNFFRGGAPAYGLTNNVVQAPVAVSNPLFGFLVQAVFEGRTVTLANNQVHGFGHLEAGMHFLHCATDTTITVQGGEINNVQIAGIRGVTYDPGSSTTTTTNPVKVAVAGTVIRHVPGGAGVLFSNPTLDTSKAAALTLQSGVVITNAGTGIALRGQGASLSLPGALPVRLDAVGTYIDLQSNGGTVPVSNVDATQVLFDGVLGVGMSEAQGFAVEDKVGHKLDEAGRGLVVWRAGHYYVTTNSGSIARAVGPAVGGDVVHVAAGVYAEAVYINEALALVGPGVVSGAVFTYEGQALVVSNNFFGGSVLVVTNGAVVSGVGTVGGLRVKRGGEVRPGASPGVLTVAGDVEWAEDGVYEWEIADATGGEGVGWDLLQVGNDLQVTATLADPLVLKVVGTPVNFNPANAYTWRVAQVGGSLIGFSGGKVVLDLSGFGHAYTGTFVVVSVGNDVVVKYLPTTGVLTVDAGGGGDYFTIQAAVNAAAPGNTIIVYPGVYVENVTNINKANLKLVGPNDGVEGFGVRGPEAEVRPAVNDPVFSGLFEVMASGVEVRGFKFEGDNPLLSGGEAVGSADANVAAGVYNSANVDHVVVRDNVFRNLAMAGVYWYIDDGSNRSWNYIDRNKFEQMREGVQVYGMHVGVRRNVMVNVGMGVSVHGVAVASDMGFVSEVSHNEVELGAEDVWYVGNTRTVGLWVNYRRGGAPELVVSNNVVRMPVGAVGELQGIQLQTVLEGRVVTVVSNVVEGMGHGAVGVYGLNLAPGTGVVVRGGVVSGVNGAGVRVATHDGVWGDAEVRLGVEGLAVRDVVGGRGLEVLSSNVDPTKAAKLVVQGGVVVSNAAVGVWVSGAGAEVSFAGSSAANLQAVGNYIELASNGFTVPTNDVLAVEVFFDGVKGDAMTPAQLFATEDKITHKVDDVNRGLVIWKDLHTFVTPAVGNIQNGVDAAPSEQTLNIAGGTYSGNVNVADILDVSIGTTNATAQVVQNGDLALNSFARWMIEINGTTPGTDFDQIVVNGAVDLGGAALSARVTVAIPPATELIIIANDGTDAVTGTFSGLPNLAPITIDGQDFIVRYNGGDGNDVVLRRVFPNVAPTLIDKVVVLNPQAEDSPMPVGAVGTPITTLVSFVGSGGIENVTDPDSGAVTGIAVIGADTMHGTWYFTIDGGATWNALGAVSGTSARLLAANAATRLYFVGNPDWNGTLSSALTFRAWDQTYGVNGQGGVDTSYNGLDSAFSSQTDTAALVVWEVNDPPVAGTDTAGPVLEDTPLVFPAAPLISNDLPAPPSVTNESGQSLTVVGVLATTLYGGTASYFSGNITYNPPPNFNGTDVLYYQVQDNGTSNGSPDPKTAIGMVLITVTPDPVDDLRPYFFYAATNFPAGLGPHSIAVGDFDGDFILDLAVANYKTNTVSILQGNGAGHFSLLSVASVGTNPAAVVTADFNNDTLPDLAVANDTSNSVTVLLNLGAANFAATHYPVGSNAFHLAVGLFNGDASPDLAVVSYLENKVQIMLNNGDGTFAAPTSYAVQGGPVYVAAGLLNGDTYVDLAVVNYLSNSVSILTGNGMGGFSLSTNITVGTSPTALALADIDNDGDLDLVVVNEGDDTVRTLFNNGSGHFVTGANYLVGDMPSAVVVADMNADSKRDVVVANAGSNSVWVLVGNGMGGFTNYYIEAATAFGVGDEPVALALGLFNNDIDPDIAVANFSSDNVSILLNSTRLKAFPQSVTVPEDHPGYPITLTGWGNPISYVIVVPPVNGTVGGGPLPNLTYTPFPAYSGPDQIGFVVTDGYGHTSTVAYVTINVADVNDPPTFDITTNLIVVAEDSPLLTFYGFAYNISVGPPNEAGQIYRFITSNNNSGLFISQPTVRSSGNLDFRPAPNAHGSALVTVWMQDNGGTNNGGWDISVPKQFTIQVTNVNDPPVVFPASVVSQRVPEDTIAVFTLGLFDLESPANTLTLTVTSTNHALLPPVPPHVTYTFDHTGTNMLISCLPVTNMHGKTVLTFTISDGTNSTSRTTTLQVDPVNDPPSFTIISNVINWTGTAGTFTSTNFITSWSVGPPNESTQTPYWWIVNTNTALFTSQPFINNTTKAFSFKPKTGVTGSVTLDLYMRDNGGGAVTNYQFGPLQLTINITP